jgi:hypothetical protein
VEDVRRLLAPQVERIVRDGPEDPLGGSLERFRRLPQREANQLVAAGVPPCADLDEAGGTVRCLVDPVHVHPPRASAQATPVTPARAVSARRARLAADLLGDRAAYLIAHLGTLQRAQLRSCCRWPVLRGRLPARGIGVRGSAAASRSANPALRRLSRR